MKLMFGRCIIFALVVIVSGCTSTQPEIKQTKISQQQTQPTYLGLKKRLAVADFECAVKGVEDEVGRGLTEMLITALHQTDRFIIVERKALAEILKEQALGATGAVGRTTEAKIGELLGAQVIVKGVITEFQETQSAAGLGGVIKDIAGGIGKVTGYVALDLRMFDTTTGELLASHRAKGKVEKIGLIAGLSIKNVKIGGGGFKGTAVGEATRKAIEDAVSFIVSKLEPIPWHGRIMLSKENKIYINAGSNVGVKVGDIFDVYSKGEELIDPETGLSLGFEQNKIGRIQVSSVEDKFSIAMVIAGSGGKKGDFIKFSTGTDKEMLPYTTQTQQEIPKLRTLVAISHLHKDRRIDPSPAETEIIKHLLKEEFEVIQRDQIKEISKDTINKALKDDKVAKQLGLQFDADIIIIGQAFSEFGATLTGGLVSCKAVVQARTIEVAKGEIIVADSKVAGGIDISEDAASKKAVTAAAAELAKQFISQIKEKIKEQKIKTIKTIDVIIYQIDYAQLMKIENVLKGVEGIESMKVMSFSDKDKIAKLNVKVTKDVNELAKELYTKDFGDFGLQINSYSSQLIELTVKKK